MFAALKKMADKSRVGPEYNQHGRVVDSRVFNQINILIGLAEHKMTITNSALRDSISSPPS